MLGTWIFVIYPTWDRINDMNTGRKHKYSVTLPEELAEEAKKNSGERGFSAYLSEALEHKLMMDGLKNYVDTVAAEEGLPGPEVYAQMRADVAAAEQKRLERLAAKEPVAA
jgi:hypothetical protein